MNQESSPQMLKITQIKNDPRPD